MGNMDVLAIPKADAKGTKGSISGADPSDGQNAAAGFAAIFANWVQGLEGQNNSGNGQAQDQSTDGETKGGVVAGAGAVQLGLLKSSGDLADPNAFFTMVPAGKEANSGGETGQSGVWDKALEALAKGDFKGAWMALSSGGITPNISELDQYKVQITYLLDQLSGQVTEGADELTDLLQQLKGQNGLAALFSFLEKAGMSSTEQNGTVSLKAAVQDISTMPETGEPEGANQQKDLLPAGATVNEKAMSEKAAQGSAGLFAENKQTLTNEIKSVNDQAGAGQSAGVDVGEKAGNAAALYGSMSQGDNHENGSGQEKSPQQGARSEITYGLFGDKVNVSLARPAAGSEALQQTHQATPVWEQVQAALRAALKERQADRTELRQLTIQLRPASLGSIQIALRWDDGVVHLHCLASQSSTGQTLQDKMPELRQSLENMGIACGNMETGFSNDQQDSRQQEYNRERLGLHVVPGTQETVSGIELEEVTAEPASNTSEEPVGDYQVNVKA